ncbi:hypothetical protein [Ruegeria halocynthiae]|nr:hypothetical protein [Ruegeria halocynthiae]
MNIARNSVNRFLAAIFVSAKLVAFSYAVGGAQPAMAGGFTACEQPFIFEGSAANIVPLEYVATSVDRTAIETERSEKLQETARRLSWLFKLDSWHQATYGSLGVVAHMFLGQVCEADEVLQELLLGRSGLPVRKDQILIILHGRIFIEDGQIFVQSQVSGFRRRSHPDEFVMPLAANFASETLSVHLAASDKSLFVSLPVLDMTFAPRVISEDLFDRIDATFLEASRVFTRPDLDAPSDELLFQPGRPRAFSVRITDEPGWIEIEDRFGGHPDRGFIRVNPEASGLFHRNLPELDFLNGLLGFLRVQQVRNSTDFTPTHDRAALQTMNAFERYLGNDLTAYEPEVRALANGLVGFVKASELNDWPGARKAFLRAAELAPTDTHYRNALGVTDAVLCCVDVGSSPYRDPTRWFADAVSVDPKNGEALGNMLHFLEFLSSAEEPPENINVSNLPRTLEVVRKVAEQNPDLIRGGLD